MISAAAEDVIVWTTGGTSKGAGHVRRCLSLAEALRERQTETLFVVDGDERIAAYVRAHGFRAVTDSGSPYATVRSLARTNTRRTGIIVDSYSVGADDLRSLHNEFMVVAIDDLADREMPVDLVVNSSPAMRASDYRALSTTEYLIGPRFAVLRREFSSAPPDGRVRNRVSRVLISVGGSDPHALTERVASWCRNALGSNVAMDVVIGPFFGSDDEGRILAAARDAALHRDPANMRDLMLSADLAICAGGQTLFELAATATPSIAIRTASNQTANLQAFQRLGTLEWIGNAEDPALKSSIINTLRSIASNPVRRDAMSRRARQIVDGCGAQRVATSISGRLH